MHRATPHTETSKRRIEIVPRRPDLSFPPERVRRHFYRDDPWLTHFFSNFSVQAGPIESFFLKDGKDALDEDAISSPRLRAEVSAYLQQEALHGALHDEFNDLLASRGYPVAWAQDLVRERLRRVAGRRRRMLRGAMAVAGEHVLGELFELALEHPALEDGLDPDFARLLRWHAYEEMEHKSVAIDAYHDIFGRNWRSWLVRLGGLLAFLWVVIPTGAKIQAAFRRTDGVRLGLRGRARLLRFYFVSPAVALRVGRALAAFSSPWFHPWRYRDNAEALEGHRARSIREEWAVRRTARRARTTPTAGDP